MVSAAPARSRANTPVAEKYVNMRTQAFTRTHAQAMEQYVQSHGSEEGYWEDFNRKRLSSEQKWRRDVEAIERDPNMSYMEKRAAKNRLTRLYPAWDEEQERRFIDLYGDPRMVDRGNLMRLLDLHQAPVFQGAMVGGDMRDVEKHPWERKFYDAIVSPKDGSVPLAIETPSFAPGASSGAAAALPAAPSVAVSGSYSPDPEIQRMAEDFAKNVCPHCRQHFKKLNSNHTNNCKARLAPAELTIDV